MADATYSTTGTTVSQSTDFGRKYNVKIYKHADNVNGVQYPNSTETITQFTQAKITDSILDVSDLRCVFDIKRYAMYYPNTAQITIYNLTAATEASITYEGYRVQVYAGYEKSTTDNNYGLIFDGDVLMCSRQKTNGVDYTLTILAMDGGIMYTEGYANFTVARGATARDIVTGIVNKSSVAVSLGHVTTALDTQKYSTSQAVHGLVKNTLNDICKTINGTWFVDNGVLHILQYAADKSYLPAGKQAVVLDPSHGLIGNPTQVDYGVSCKCFLNAQIVPYGMINISKSLITLQLVTVGTYSEGVGTQKNPIDPYGLYRVISVNHHGDTRGNDWYSSISAISQSNGAIPAMLTSVANSAN